VAVKGLDDRLDAASQALATQPSAYKPGTLATIADGFDSAGEPNKASAVRRAALQETFLLPFAQSSAAAQQRLIDNLPEGEDRAAAEAIQRHQAEAFARDPFAAGTALYPDVGPPVPIEDVAGRIRQARTIAAYRGIPVMPFAADEIATMRRQLADGTPQERDAVLAQVNALPEDMKATSYSTPEPRSEETPISSQDQHIAQSIWPFLAKPPSYPVQPRPVLRYKEPIPGLSGKEKADDVPSAFRGMRPLVGETGKQAAERVFDEKYGKGQWDLKDPEIKDQFNKVKKYFERGFRDPKTLPGLENRIPGEEFQV